MMDLSKVAVSLSVFGGTSFLIGCVAAVTPETVKTTPTNSICTSIVGSRFGNAPKESGPLGLSELKRRRAFSDRELDAIANGKLFIGMSEQAMYCSIGAFDYGVNITTTASGTTKQYLVGDGNYNKRIYVYTSDGVVTAIQS